MNNIIGGCGKHPGQNMVNCPLCEIESLKKEQLTFTPGPWYAVDYSGFFNLQVDEFYTDKGNLLDAEENPNAEQDALLAASAPDLYEALNQLVHLHMCEQEGLLSGKPTPKMWLEAVDRASNALSKATL